jgi:hypothetical protein
MTNSKNDYKIGEVYGILSGIKSDIDEIKKFMSKYDDRIASLEQSRSQLVGAIAVISSIVSFFMMIIGAFVQKVIAGLR